MSRTHASRVDSPLDRLLRSLLPLTVAIAFWVAWLDPSLLVDGALRSLQITLTLEMLALHSGAFIGFLVVRVADGDRRRLRSSVAMAIPVAALYLLSGWQLGREANSWWPLVACAWLVVGRVLPLRHRDRSTRDVAVRAMMIEWVASVLVFVVTLAVTADSALPMFGLEGMDARVASDIQWGALHFLAIAGLPWLLALLPIRRWVEREAAERARRGRASTRGDETSGGAPPR